MEKDEIELQRIQEAPNYKSCLDWKKHCNNECCQIMEFNLGKKYKPRIGQKVHLNIDLMDDDMRWYYDLHGGRFNREKNTLDFTLVKFRMNKQTGKLTHHRKCNLLQKDGKCEGFPDKRPNFCKMLNKDTASASNVYLTENCVFKYQVAIEQMEKEEDAT